MSHWWENNFIKARGGILYLGQKQAASLAAEHGTPLFIYSKAQILSNFKTLLKAFADKTSLEIRIYYAMKANSHPGIMKIVKDAGCGIDAVSPGEIRRALRAGFSREKILFTGTSLSLEDIKQAFAQQEIIVNIDAEEQLELMREVKEKRFKKKKIRVSLRWNPGIGRGFSSKVVTAGEKSFDGTPIKFGIEESKVIPTLAKAVDYGFIPVGLHQHLGSGWTKEDFEGIKIAVDKMVDKALELQEQGFPLEFLDFGGGFGPRYSPKHEIFPLKDYAEYIWRKIEQSELQIKAIALEPGKYLVGDAGVLLVKVEYLKKSYGNFFACVNAGTFNAVPRLSIYAEAYHHIVNCSKLDSGETARVTVAGNLCETGDVFGKEMEMPVPERGDILAVLGAGAYCRSMASNFNLREIPKEIII
jgi:diaminopimelate decarboxylase